MSVTLNSNARTYFYRRKQQRYAQRETERKKWLLRVRETIQHHAPHYAGIRQVYIFGSLLKPGQFRSNSDIDIAVKCDALESESAFWRSVEQTLHRNVDLRPLKDPLKEVIALSGELVYERPNHHPDKKYST